MYLVHVRFSRIKLEASLKAITIAWLTRPHLKKYVTIIGLTKIRITALISFLNVCVFVGVCAIYSIKRFYFGYNSQKYLLKTQTYTRIILCSVFSLSDLFPANCFSFVTRQFADMNPKFDMSTSRNQLNVRCSNGPRRSMVRLTDHLKSHRIEFYYLSVCLVAA